MDHPVHKHTEWRPQRLLLGSQPIFFRNGNRGGHAVSAFASAQFRSHEVGNEEFAIAAVDSEMRAVDTRGARHLNNSPRAGFELDEKRVAVVAGNRLAASFRHERCEIAEYAARSSQDQPEAVRRMRSQCAECAAAFRCVGPPVPLGIFGLRSPSELCDEVRHSNFTYIVLTQQVLSIRPPR